MTEKTLPSVDLLRKLLDYDPETGSVRWKTRTPDLFTATPSRSAEVSCANFNTLWAGRETALAEFRNGYRTLSIKAAGLAFNSMLAHRVVWAIYYGAYPKGQIDHINGIRSDNRINNLRDVSADKNRRNAKRRSNNTSGFGGVYYKASRRKWVANISNDGVRTHLGVFEYRFDAVLARLLAEKAHGYTARHGL